MPVPATIAPKPAAPASRSNLASHALAKAAPGPKAEASPAPTRSPVAALPVFVRAALLSPNPATSPGDSHGAAPLTAAKPAPQLHSGLKAVSHAPAAIDKVEPKPPPRLAPLAPLRGATAGAGQPLAPHIKEAIQNSLLVDLSSVRLHASTAAERKAQSLSARAFTFGNDIFLGRGEHPTDLTLISHEAAHVIQQQASPAVQAWSNDHGDRYEREADRAAAAVGRNQMFSVRERVASPRVQRWAISDALNYIANAANNIPGFRMFTIVLGVNPVNMEHVDRTPANVLRAVVEFIPGGAQITKALDQYGIFDKVGNWVQQQLDTLGIIGSSIKKSLMDFLDSLSWTDIFRIDDVWERAKRIFTEPIDRIKNFVVGLLEGIWKFVRDAILMPLAKLAEGTAGWPLLTAVLGKNPITGEAVPRTPETLIGGFMKLVHEDELWANIQRTNALGRAWSWFQGALNSLMGFVAQVPALFLQALKSLEWSDILILPQGFMKVAGVFGKFLGNFISWAGNAVWDLLQIVFEAVAPAVMPYLRKVGAAFKSILKNPIGFVHNLVEGAKLGFENFADNFGTHLKAGLIDWLVGSLPGVYIPKAMTLPEFGKFAISVLGISWAQIRGKIVKELGPNGDKIMTALETAFDIVVALVKGGPAAAWELIQDKLTNLKDMVIDGIVGFVTDTIIKKAVPKLISLFIPGAGFISAIMSIYDTVMVFVQKLAKMAAAVKAFVDSIVAIANGQIEGAAKKVESALEGLLSLAISFLAGFLGLGNVASKILEVIKKVQDVVDKALDTAIKWVIDKAKKLFASLFGKPDKPDERTAEQKQADLDKGIAEAETLQKVPDTSDAKIKNGLQAIKKKYKMTSLELVVDSDDTSKETLHVEGEINPKKSTPKSDIKKGLPAQQAHEEVMAKMSDSNKTLLQGHGSYVPGYAGRSFTIDTRNPLDDIGYASGDHSSSSIMDPGTKPLPETNWGKKGKGSWIPDHQPPDTLADGGASLTFRFYPHSLTSARQQGGAVRVYKMWMKEARKRDDSNWSEGVQSSWFW